MIQTHNFPFGAVWKESLCKQALFSRLRNKKEPRRVLFTAHRCSFYRVSSYPAYPAAETVQTGRADPFSCGAGSFRVSMLQYWHGARRAAPPALLCRASFPDGCTADARARPSQWLSAVNASSSGRTPGTMRHTASGNCHRGNLPTGQHKVTDGNLLVHALVDKPLVNALIMAADQNKVLLCEQLTRFLLLNGCPCAERNTVCTCSPALSADGTDTAAQPA